VKHSLVCRLCVPAFFLAASTGPGGAQAAALPGAAQADPAIVEALQQVSSDRVRATIEKLVSFGNRSTLSTAETDLPAGTGAAAAANWVEQEFKRYSAECGGCLEVKRDDFVEPGAPNTRILKPTKLTNVYAVLHGSDPAQAARRVLVTGHYDSRNSDNFNTHDPAPGANDDASGVAVSLECARVLSKLKFPSTIVFVAVAGEEQGLNGSRHLARLAKSEGWQLEAVLNNDIVGGDTTPGDTTQDKNAVRIFSEGVPGPATLDQLHLIQTLGSESDSPSRELARAIADVSRTYLRASSQRPPAIAGRARSNMIRIVPAFHPVLIFRRDRFLRGGDHTSFNLEGFPAVRFTEWQENFNHQHQTPRTENGVEMGDFLKFVDFDYVANVARLNAASLANFAFAPGIPQEVHVATNGLDNSTEITWQAPVGMPTGASYEILSRPTDQPDWVTVQPVAATTVKLAVSKDNTIFGIRSVDPAGHRSYAAYPVPARSMRNPPGVSAPPAPPVVK
jgi:hypothetical protein